MSGTTRVISVGEHRFATWRTDGAAPTIVFEAGLGAESAEWGPVTDGLPRGIAAFRYDRLNRGGSSRVAGPRTSSDMAGDLRRILTAAEISPPYILVGHSFGAHVALAAADRAVDVVGVVLVDPTHPRQFDVFGPHLPPGDMRDFWTGGWRRPDTTPEHIDFPASFAATGRVALDAIPMIVLVAGAAMAQGGPRAQRQWDEMASDWLSCSSQATLEVVSDSGHFMQRDAPGRITNAVRRLMS